MTIPCRAVAVLFLLVLLGVLVPPAPAQQPRAPQPPRPAAPAPDSQRLLRALEDAFVSVADRATPSVVNVSVKVKRETRPEGGGAPEMEERFREFFGPELFERFFRRRAPRDEGRAAGSGVLVDPRGYILTNNHVVEDATKIEVALYADEPDVSYKAKVIGRDPLTDSALIQLVEKPNHPLPEAKFGDSSQVEAGDWVMAIGNPFGYAHTVTVGVISATSRAFRVTDGRTNDMLQTDAAINPGNSGGPVFMNDELIGIAFQSYKQKDLEKAGYVVPIPIIRHLFDDLEDGAVTPPAPGPHPEFDEVGVMTFDPDLIALHSRSIMTGRRPVRNHAAAGCQSEPNRSPSVCRLSIPCPDWSVPCPRSSWS